MSWPAPKLLSCFGCFQWSAPGFAELFRILRFGCVGIVATGAYAAVTATVMELTGMGLVAASTIGNLSAIGISYLGHLYVTFQVPADHRAFLPRFFILAFASLALNLVITWVFSEVVPLPYPVVVAIVLAAIPAASYVASRFWVYHPALSDQRRAAASRNDKQQGGP